MDTRETAAQFMAACVDECRQVEADQRSRDYYRELTARIMRKERAAWLVPAGADPFSNSAKAERIAVMGL
jgi:hypothetical protein